MSAPIPDLTTPLVHEPIDGPPQAPSTPDLDLFHKLIGTWINSDPLDPYSYNVMVLPQSPAADPNSPQGYVLKNQRYYEEMTISPLDGTANNRGGHGTQVCNVLFYEQRVYFAPDPQIPDDTQNTLVHAENGSWLYLTDQQQDVGPYGPPPNPFGAAPTQTYPLAKQMSVPHGNSILATGSLHPSMAGDMPLTIPDANGIPTAPVGAPANFLDPYLAPSESQRVGNPDLAATKNPNLPLQMALAAGAKQPTNWLVFHVSSANAGHEPTNIGFEDQHAHVTSYETTIWLESFDDTDNYTQLQYSQTIWFNLSIDGFNEPVLFPHVTSNTLSKTGTSY